jgi:hypothetical protein
MDNLKNMEYCLMDNNAMPLEKSNSFDLNITGNILDITQRAKNILTPSTGPNSIEIFYESQVVLIKDNHNLNMTLIADNK